MDDLHRTSLSLPSELLSVVMPAYNESEHVEQNLLETVATLTSSGFDFEVILVDDGSRDGTYDEALKAQERHPDRIKVVRCNANAGKGSALVRGTAQATGEYVVFLDSDLDLHPSLVPPLFALLRETKADVIIGSKLHAKSRVRGYPFVRRLYSRAYYAMTRALFGLPVKDTQTGIKIFKTGVLRNVFPFVTIRRFAFDLEVLALAHLSGYRIVDGPVRLDFQRAAGRIVLRDALVVALDTFRVFLRLHSVDFRSVDFRLLTSGRESEALEA